MNWRKKLSALALALALCVSLAACGGKTAAPETPVETPAETAQTPEPAQPQAQTEPAAPDEETVTLRAAALKGPTAMGLVKLMADAGFTGEASEAEGAYAFSLAAAPDEVTPLLIKGDLDVACVPANLASVLYNRTEGQIVTLAVNTLGVLYIVEKGETVQSMADLKGTTVVASGKGSTPEYALRYLLTENGIDPDQDLTIEWKSEHSECVAALASGAATIALLPQPFVTVAMGKVEGLRTALDLTAEWDALGNGSALLTGVVAARRDFVEAHPEAVSRFLADYAASVAWVNDHPADAAALIGEYGIVDAAVAEKALPFCNIVCITGDEMAQKLSGYLQVLFDAAPESVGGAVPGSDFYYGA